MENVLAVDVLIQQSTCNKVNYLQQIAALLQALKASLDRGIPRHQGASFAGP